MTQSLWTSWKNRILGNGDTEAFDPFDPRVLKSPPDPADSYALRTRCGAVGHRHVEILGTGVPDLVGDCVAAMIGKLDRIGQTPITYPPDPSHRHITHTRSCRVDPDRHHAAMPQAHIGLDMPASFSLLENDAR